MIYSDFRNKELRDRQFLYLAVEPANHPAATTGTAYATFAEARASLCGGGYVISLHRATIQWLKRITAFRAGMVLSFWRGRRSVVEVSRLERDYPKKFTTRTYRPHHAIL